MIETFMLDLPHGIRLSCRSAGMRGRPVLLFLHGFPEAAFVWDALLEHFAQPAHGAWFCVAPNLRGYEHSSAPVEVSAYKAKHLVQDICATIDAITADSPTPGRLGALIAHDWGGALAWSVAAQHPQRMSRLVIINAPHPAAFQHGLAHSPEQQAASAYMNFLAQADAPERLAADDYALLWPFFSTLAGGRDQPVWLDEAMRDRYRAVWALSLRGGCHYYGASPLRPPTATDPGASAVQLPAHMVTVQVPTLVVWGMRDAALPPSLLDGLSEWVPDLRIERVPDASHWIVHEQAETVMRLAELFLLAPHSPS